jgi:hypothetical protein
MVIPLDISLEIGPIQVHLLLTHQVGDLHLTLLLDLFIQRLLITVLKLLGPVPLHFYPKLPLLRLLYVLTLLKLLLLLLHLEQPLAVIHLPLNLLEHPLLFFLDLLSLHPLLADLLLKVLLDVHLFFVEVLQVLLDLRQDDVLLVPVVLFFVLLVEVSELLPKLGLATLVLLRLNVRFPYL